MDPIAKDILYFFAALVALGLLLRLLSWLDAKLNVAKETARKLKLENDAQEIENEAKRNSR